MSTISPCPCEGSQDPQVVSNPPNLPVISYRVDDFTGFRRALLRSRPGETALLGWQPAAGDLGVQMLEWWAYLADILTFYNERIANESYLRTAQLPASVAALVALLGYQPRPAIAATGQLAAVRRPGRPNEPLVVPAGTQFASTATPGVPAQTFESGPASSFSGATDAPAVIVPAPDLLTPAPTAAYPYAQSVLLAGNVGGIKPGDQLLLLPSGWAGSDDIWAWTTVLTVAAQPDPNGGVNTCVTFESVGWGPSSASNLSAAASDYRLLRPTQTAALWSLTPTPIAGSSPSLTADLSAVVRAFEPGDVVLFDGPRQRGISRGQHRIPGNSGKALASVTATSEILQSVQYPGNTGPTNGPADFAVPCTQLSVTTQDGTVMDRMNSFPTQVAVRYGFRDVGTPIAVPATALSLLPANVTVPAGFALPDGQSTAMIEDSTGAGILVGVTSLGNNKMQLNAILAMPQTLTPSLIPPLRLLADLVAVSRGTSVPSETLGTGDATVPNQTFTLKQSPLTNLAQGDGYVSALQIAVDGIYWQQVATVYGQPPDATIFTVTQQADGTSVVRFGDGVEGARLPTGSQVVATYRYGGGAASPPAGRLTTILQPQPNLAAVHNPVAVTPGADAEAPDSVRVNAPASVLSFGRAISADDYETIAAAAPGVSRARAYWSWDEQEQRTLVKVYVGDTPAAAALATAALAGAADPNRPVVAEPATPIGLTLSCALVIAADRVAADVLAAAQAAVGDPATGLFSPANMAIGATLYSSQIESALLVDGAVAVHGLSVLAGDAPLFAEPVGYASPGEGGFYTLTSATITQDTSNG
jgi:Baseplate J-like protein